MSNVQSQTQSCEGVIIVQLPVSHAQQELEALG